MANVNQAALITDRQGYHNDNNEIDKMKEYREKREMTKNKMYIYNRREGGGRGREGVRTGINHSGEINGYHIIKIYQIPKL